MEISTQDEQHLRRAMALAAQARESGENPFGSVLVDGSGEVVAEDWNTTRSEQDLTAHPELKLARLAGRTLKPEQAAAATLYTSCEPCAMCGEALLRSGVGRVVFALSADQLDSLIGDPGRVPPRSQGPLLHEEAVAAIGDYRG